MKTKILAAVALTTLLGTGLYAVSCNFGGQQGMYGYKGDYRMMKQGMMQNGQGMMQNGQGMMQPGIGNCPIKTNKSHMMGKRGLHMMGKKGDRGVMGIFRQLNLTTEQRAKIIDIKREIMAQNRTGVETAFTKDSFDKAKFIELMKQKRDYMLESRAKMVDKVYALLTTEQKEQFKVLLDLQQERRANMMQGINKMNNMQNMRRGMNF